MPIELAEEQRLVLQETKAVDTPDQFEGLLQDAKPEMARVVREVMGPNQPITGTLTEMRDLYLSVTQHQVALAKTGYGAARRALLCGAIRLLDTASTWFSEGSRGGAYKVRTVEQIVVTSRPWRARLSAYGAQAFVFEQETADVFADVNTSGTLDEEIADLKALLREANLHKDQLIAVGMSEAFLREGETLLREAEGRDLLGVLGLRNLEEAQTLRNTILTYAIQLSREARAAGINGCYDDPAARRRFEAASFRNALRRLRGRRPGSGGADTDAGAGEAPAEPPAGTPG